ncbi:1 carbohydrate esterase [Oopsacas minuta]|uniref:1 carbohydrate esterase n=1 Tax=Oopsacas minuta TaxID=111878 RepID=A0AAV7K5R8_9METZ|nr:1 carbohydrate esterase [Oopsacas minuta]
MTSSGYSSDNETPFGSTVSSYIDLREVDGASNFREDFKIIEKKLSTATFNEQDWVKCKFSLVTDKKYSNVILMGDFTSWDSYPITLQACEKGYETTVMLLKGVYEYKFRADGKWTSDPQNPYKTANYGNSLLYVGINPLDWKCNHWRMPNLEYIRPNCNFWYFIEVPTGLTVEVGKAGLRKRPLYVFLPPGYESASSPLPVVYTIDGYDSFSNGNEGRFLDQFLDSKWKSGSLPEFIFVAIPSMEVAFPGFEKKDLFIKNFSEIENEAYLKFLIDIVVPTIKSKYNVSSDPKHSVIMGDHYGGLAAFVASLLYPETFGQAISLSPSFGYHDRNNSSIFDFMRSQKPTMKSLFYLDSSNIPGDNKHMTEAMATHLSKSKIPSVNYLHQNLCFDPLENKARLSNPDWQMRVEKALHFIFK